METPKLKRIRGFSMHSTRGQTMVSICELNNGNMEVVLETKRDDLEPLCTTMQLTPATFNMLTEALFLAAHDENAFFEIEGREENAYGQPLSNAGLDDHP